MGYFLSSRLVILGATEQRQWVLGHNEAYTRLKYTVPQFSVRSQTCFVFSAVLESVRFISTKLSECKRVFSV
jgi:hypothetical protein